MFFFNYTYSKDGSVSCQLYLIGFLDMHARKMQFGQTLTGSRRGASKIEAAARKECIVAYCNTWLSFMSESSVHYLSSHPCQPVQLQAN